MPTITDATVVAQAYSTSGNGGRKLVRLDNGWLVATAKTTSYIYFYVSKDNGQSFSQLCYAYDVYFVSGQDYAITNKGNYVYLIYGVSTQIQFKYFDATTVSNANINTGTSYVENVAQNAIGNTSLAINEAKTELHAAWASKNATYPNSFNIRYAKGTINADGTVAWRNVEQLTITNSIGQDVLSPTVVVRQDNKPIVIYSYAAGVQALYFDGVSWVAKGIYAPGSTYAQSSPSAIFVPQSINGLTAVAWHGTDSASSGANYIRFNKSTDGGVTWSTALKLVVGTNASLTANKTGKLFITYEDAGVTKCIESTDNGENWGSPITVGIGTSPSTLFDLSMQISVPLTIYKGTSSVLFSGSWTTSSISPTQGDRGVITNRQSMMTYAITSDGTIGTVTEKINGVTVGTKTLTSGQNTTISITQAQWDNIKYGKYRDINANRNTITIETANGNYTYTFDKEPASTSDIISQAKAVKDSAEVSMPAKKKILSDAINAKGGSTTSTDSIEVMASSIKGSSIGRYATGTLLPSTTAQNFKTGETSNLSCFYLSLDTSVIGFKPKAIQVTRTSTDYQSNYSYNKIPFFVNGGFGANFQFYDGSNTRIFRIDGDSDLIKIPVSTVSISGMSFTFYAFE